MNQLGAVMQVAVGAGSDLGTLSDVLVLDPQAEVLGSLHLHAQAQDAGSC